MNFSINPQKYGSVFVLPYEVADKYLKTCSGAFLRVLLVLYRIAPAPATPEILASRAGVSPEEAADALDFWTSEGLVLTCESENNPVLEAGLHSSEGSVHIIEEAHTQSTETVASENHGNAGESDTPATLQTIVPKKTRLKPVLPSYQQVHSRSAESEQVRTLFTEAQEYLGRTIGLADQSSLLLLYDFYGLPIDIILMLCGYAAGQGKSGNMRYITAMGENWSEREIDTDEKAQAELKRLENTDEHWQQLRSVTGIRSPNPTKAQRDYIAKWYCDMGFSTEMLSIAFAKMSEATTGMSFAYMDKILTRWAAEGIKTPQDVETNDQAHKAQRSERAAGSGRAAPKNEIEGGFSTGEASYDIEKAMENPFKVPKSTKRRRK